MNHVPMYVKSFVHNMEMVLFYYKKCWVFRLKSRINVTSCLYCIIVRPTSAPTTETSVQPITPPPIGANSTSVQPTGTLPVGANSTSVQPTGTPTIRTDITSVQTVTNQASVQPTNETSNTTPTNGMDGISLMNRFLIIMVAILCVVIVFVILVLPVLICPLYGKFLALYFV